MKEQTDRGLGPTFAGVGSCGRTTLVSEVTFLTVLAVTTLCVVEAVVTHTTAPPAACQPQFTTEVAAVGVTVAFALCCWETTNTNKY